MFSILTTTISDVNFLAKHQRAFQHYFVAASLTRHLKTQPYGTHEVKLGYDCALILCAMLR